MSSTARVTVICRWPEQPGSVFGGFPSPLCEVFPSHTDVEVIIDGRIVTNIGEVRFESKPGEVPRLFVEFIGAEVVLESPVVSRDVKAAPVRVFGSTPNRPGVCRNCGREGDVMQDGTCRRGCGHGH